MKPKIVFPLLTLILIAIIWGHSVMPADLSSEESGIVGDIVRFLFRLDPTADIDHYVRKTAHFTEYAMLGIMVAIDTALLAKRSFSPYSIITGIFTALIDETIQLFSSGRSGMITDVWLDFSGFVTGFICCVIILRITSKKE